MTGSRRDGTRRAGRVAALVTTLALLATGCSAAGNSSSSQAVGGQEAPAQAAPAQVAGGKAADGKAAQPATAADRQVVTTGTLTLVTTKPTSTVKDVVALVDKNGGRVDSRSETAATSDTPGSATLTVRVPSDKVSAVIDGLRDLGTVSALTLDAQDVTAAAQDLDARIAAQKISVARMEDVLSRAATTSDVVAAEDALRQRQSDLEAMVAERNRIADQVALSTLTITLSAPSVVEPSGPTSFWAALATGWSSLVDGLATLVLVLGVVLPWLAFLALVAWPIVWFARRRKARRTGGPGGPSAAMPPSPGAPFPPGVGGPAAPSAPVGGPPEHPLAPPVRLGPSD